MSLAKSLAKTGLVLLTASIFISASVSPALASTKVGDGRAAVRPATAQ